MNSKTRGRAATESLLGSFGILLVGFLTIPLAATAVGASVSMTQGASMSILFFFGRWVYLFLLRMWFAKGDVSNG